MTPDRHRIYCSKDVAGETTRLLAINLRRSMDGMRGQIHLAARAGQLLSHSVNRLDHSATEYGRGLVVEVDVLRQRPEQVIRR